MPSGGKFYLPPHFEVVRLFSEMMGAWGAALKTLETEDPAQLIFNLSRSINEGIEQSAGEINLDHSIFSELNFDGRVRLLLCCLERYG